MKQQFIVNCADTFKARIYEMNRGIVPASAALTVYKPGGGALLVDALPMTVLSDGTLTYGLSAGENAVAGINYKAVITYVYGSRTDYATFFYDVVNSRLAKVITDEDIIAELPQIKDNGWRVRGAADGGSATTIVDAELKRYEDDYFTGGLAHSLDKDEVREITGFASATGTATVTSFSSAVAAGERYLLMRSYSREIQRAFEKIEELLNRTGRRAHLVLDPHDLREVHIHYSVAEVCKGLVTDADGVWWGLWKDYEKKAEEAFRGINFKYDSSEEGYISAGEEGAAMEVTRTVRR
jgi:hypothetical protein